MPTTTNRRAGEKLQAGGGGNLPRKRRGKAEEALHVAVANFLRLAIRPPWMWTTFPAGGGGKVRGARLKAAGLRAGMPDILVIGPQAFAVPYEPWSVTVPLVVGIELKAAKGRLSPAQTDTLKALDACGIPTTECRSVEEVEKALEESYVPCFASARRRAA